MKTFLTIKSIGRKWSANCSLLLGSSLLLVGLSAIADDSITTIPQPSSTSDSSSIVSAINNFHTDVSASFEAFTTQLNKLFLDASSSLTASSQQPNLAIYNPANAFQFTTTSDSQKTSALPIEELINNSTTQAAQQKLQYSLFPNTANTNDTSDTQLQVLLAGMDAPTKIMPYLDTSSFLNNSSYDVNQQNLYERNLAFLSDYTNSYGSVSLPDLYKNTTLLNTPLARKYLAKVFGSAVIRNFILNNEYDHYNQRIPIDGLGTRMGMSKKDASLAEANEYMAKRRVSNPQWYAQMDNATPAAIQRETLFVLVELEKLMYDMNRKLDRQILINTVQASIALRSTTSLPDKDDTDLNNQLNPPPADANSNSSSTTYTSPGIDSY